MKTAITRLPASSLTRCELTHITRTELEFGKLLDQHANYRRILTECNYNVTTLPAEPDLPDSVFVEDTAIVLPEVAILLPMGVESRKSEPSLVETELTALRKVIRLDSSANMEGGDVLRIGKDLFVGMTSRTDQIGLRTLSEVVSEFGYQVKAIPVRGSLHLKTAVTAIDDETVILNPEWVDSSAFRNYRKIETDSREPFAANELRTDRSAIVCSSHPLTNARIRRSGFEVLEVDISEFLKCEAGLTCLALLVD